jgi:UDP-N-acetylmuramoylalanine--D-glutamate ligase
MIEKVNIVGGGESGVGAAVLAKVKNLDVCVYDRDTIKQKFKETLNQYKIAFKEEQKINDLIQADVIVKSPGISDDQMIIKQLKERGNKIISEVEFAAQFTDSFIIAITGTNGKTTTTKLIGHILEKAGKDVSVAGNIGNSFAFEVATNPKPFYVVEVSSFQLDNIENFKPNIAIITDITADHLDRYQYKLENYVQAKMKITQNQDTSDYLIYNEDNQLINNALADIETRARIIPFSTEKKLDEGVYHTDEQINISIKNNKYNMSTTDLRVKGKHNQKNAMAASAVAELLNIRKETIRQSFESFDGVEHRMEEVLKIQNVTYINDSKGTNINATFYALDSMTQPTIWIAGGVDKGNNYSELLSLVNEKVKAIICIGVDNQAIFETFNKCIHPIIEVDTMQEAVQQAYSLSVPKDAVLLSPACSSFDRFVDYEDRGRQFKQAIRSL